MWYQMKCLTCEQVYVGQTGRDFKKRYKDHINDITSNKVKSRYALHILHENHEYGPTEKVMDILKAENKGKQLHTYEWFHIYKTAKQEQIINMLKRMMFYLI
jgi:hypothetical protein